VPSAYLRKPHPQFSAKHMVRNSSSLFTPRHPSASAINLTSHHQPLATSSNICLVATCIHRVLGIVCLSTLHPQLHTSLPSHEGPSLQITAVIVNKMSSSVSTGSPKLGRKASSRLDVLAHSEGRELPTTNEAAVRLNTPNRQARRATRCEGY
jgi:hypothetical protein